MRDKILTALKNVIDPDLNRDIVSLNFVKEVTVEGSHADVTIELTTPACPMKDLLKRQAEEQILSVASIETCKVTMTAQTSSGTGVKSEVVEKSLGKVNNIIAIASGKGGVGKSTTTVNLAYSLAATGAKVGILDADIYGPSLRQMTNVEDPTQMDGEFIVPAKKDGISMITVSMFTDSGKAQMLRGPMVAQIIKQFLTQVSWGELDYLLIDYPPGTGDIQLTLSQLAPLSGAVIVTTPQEVALIDVRKAIDLFDALKVPVLGVLETMSYFVCDGCDKKHRIFKEGGAKKVASEYGFKLLGEIPIDPTIADCADSGNPAVVSKSNTLGAKAYIEAAGKIAAEQSIVNSNDEGILKQFSLGWR